MRKRRLWLVIAVLLFVVSVSPHAGITEGRSKVVAVQGAKGANEQAAAGESGTAAELGVAGTSNAAEAVGSGGSAATAEPNAAETAAGGTGEAGSGGQPPEGEVSMYPVTTVTQIADNDKLIMYIDEATGNIRIVDKATKTEWLGTPLLPRSTLPNNKKFMDAAILVKYTEGVDVTQTYLSKEADNKLSIERREDGARVTFQFVKEQLEFAIEYKLLEDGFELRIDDSSIKENGNAKLVSLEPLPFWNAAAETDEGALFLPDGSGALMTYKTSHPQYFAGYSERIYGADPNYMKQSHELIFDSEWRLKYGPSEKIALPVYGNYRNGVASLGIVEQGQYDAKVNGTPSGIRNIPYYRTSVEFVYRWDDVIYIGNSGQIPFYQASAIAGDRKLRYVLLQDDEADYVGMAQAYRSYLLNSQSIEPVQTEAVPMRVKLLGGLQRDEIIGSTFISMTSFEEAKEIIDAFAAKGLHDLELVFAGWSNDGLYGDQPEHFPVEKKLGGAKDLKQLAAYAEDKGIKLYLEANYARAFSESDGMKKSKDAIRGMDREATESSAYYIGSRWNNDMYIFYWMKPERVISRHLNKELDKYESLGIDGVHFKYWGDTLYSDIDPKTPFTREQTSQAWRDAVTSVKNRLGGASVDYGYAYMLGHVDRINNAPMDSSHYIYNDRAVPFYQIAVRGLVPYTAKPINLRQDARHELLRMVEYGALPSLELTYEPTSKLQRTMEDRLWSSQYSYWAEQAAAEYEALKPIYSAIMNETIIGHEQLQQDVYRTTYSNGVQVLVNYGLTEAAIDGITIAAEGFAMQNGGK